MLVNGVDCSCYAYYSHSFCHILIKGLFYPLCKSISGFGSDEKWYDDEGVHKVARKIGKYLQKTVGKVFKGNVPQLDY